MPGLVPGIHTFARIEQDVDRRDQAGDVGKGMSTVAETGLTISAGPV